MQRLLLEELVKWKNSKGRKPLVIKGARQSGKTWLMKEFGKVEFNDTAYISFFNNSRMKRLFSSDYDTKRLLLGLGAESGVKITAGSTLIILDEIQECPKALESLKYFYENASEYHIVAAGSLLGVAIHKDVSFPVGKVQTLNLYPLNYREYLLAQGEEELLKILDARDYTLINSFHDKFMFHLKNYIYTGGMPEAVSYFSEYHDFAGTRKIQREILEQYKADFGKHIEASELERINMVWESIPVQLAKENKKFFFGHIKKGSRASDFEKAIQWLLDCGLVYKVNKVSAPNLPLSFYKDLSSFKLFLVDTGLLCAMSDLDARVLLEESDLFVEFKGALEEQYVLQEFVSDTDYHPYYYGTQSATFEQDFLIQKGNGIIPIEVKSGKNVRSQSLRAFCSKFTPSLAYRFSELPYINQGWMQNFPLYCVCEI